MKERMKVRKNKTKKEKMEKMKKEKRKKKERAEIIEFLKEQRKQVTWGHNIVEDGWAGVSHPHQNPDAPHVLKRTQKRTQNASFPSF